jgi:5-methylcytosine-specific restriction endonuclease McrA
MAEIAEIKPWDTATAGENLFLFVYRLVSPTIPCLNHEKSFLYSSFGLNEFFRLTAAMEVMHRCLNAAIPLIEISPSISSTRITEELKHTLPARPSNSEMLKLGELTRLSGLVYVNQNLTKGMTNSVHRNEKPECCWCGKPTSRSKATPSKDKSTVEHLWPEFLGGESIEENLIIACGECNGKRQHAFTWAWFGVQSCSEKLDSNKSLPREIKLSIGLHRLMKVASGQSRMSNEIITLKDAATRLRTIIPSMQLIEENRYTFLEILDNAKE